MRTFLRWLDQQDPLARPVLREVEKVGVDGIFEGGRLDFGAGAKGFGLLAEAAGALGVDMLDSMQMACEGLPPGAQTTVAIQVATRYMFVGVLWGLRLAETKAVTLKTFPLDLNNGRET